LAATYDAVIDVGQRGVEGDIVECGVARGGCAGLMGLAAVAMLVTFLWF